ncbi:hypothetical protein BJ165DRAFT_1409199 [Panaeolus papilionaceus]|nr:hypothetical protein BJ165DRAFT_1409199 [Panaeolus papilionaceus]
MGQYASRFYSLQNPRRQPTSALSATPTVRLNPVPQEWYSTPHPLRTSWWEWEAQGAFVRELTPFLISTQRREWMIEMKMRVGWKGLVRGRTPHERLLERRCFEVKASFGVVVSKLRLEGDKVADEALDDKVGAGIIDTGADVASIAICDELTTPCAVVFPMITTSSPSPIISASSVPLLPLHRLQYHQAPYKTPSPDIVHTTPNAIRKPVCVDLVVTSALEAR